jgi:hypothetical protein
MSRGAVVTGECGESSRAPARCQQCGVLEATCPELQRYLKLRAANVPSTDASRSQSRVQVLGIFSEHRVYANRCLRWTVSLITSGRPEHCDVRCTRHKSLDSIVGPEREHK